MAKDTERTTQQAGTPANTNQMAKDTACATQWAERAHR